MALSTFSFYALMHFLNGSKLEYIINFLKIFLLMLSITGLVALFKEGAEPILKDGLFVLFCFCVVSALNLVYRQKLIHYFGKR